MIYKKADFGNTEGIMVCEMGFGDIGMHGSAKGANGEVVLAFKTYSEPHPINVVEKSPYKSFDEMQPELVFIFNKVESIDSVISMLVDCREELLKE